MLLLYYSLVINTIYYLSQLEILWNIIRDEFSPFFNNYINYINANSLRYYLNLLV